MAPPLMGAIAEIERELGELRAAQGEGTPVLRTSVMTHIAWVPRGWREKARATLEGLAERHPSRTIMLYPEPAADDGIESAASVECFPLSGDTFQICSEVIELWLRGDRCRHPASLVTPLLVFDLPVFLRWRGQPEWDAPELAELVGVADRLIVDSTEWPDVPAGYESLAELFDRTAVSDIAWERTSRWRASLASLWPGIAKVEKIRVSATAAQAHLLRGWLVSRLGHPVELEHEHADRLVGVDVDGQPAPFPPGDPPDPSDLLSDQLEQYARDRVYEEAVTQAAAGGV